MAEALRVINIIKSSIREENLSSIEEHINMLPIGDINREQCNTLLGAFLKEAMESNKHSSCRKIINTFDSMRSHDPISIITGIFADLTKDILSFVINVYSERSVTDYMTDVINLEDDELALKLAANIISFFPEINDEDWQLLLRLTEDVEDVEYHNVMLRCFIESKAKKTETIPLPKWVREFPIVKLENYPTYIPSVKEAVELLTHDMRKNNININDGDVKKMLVSQYAISTSKERIFLLSSVKKLSEFDDKDIFREYGPVNTVLTSNPHLLDSDHECYKYGGCRMFLCREFGNDENSDESISCHEDLPDWFTGSCDTCAQNINSRYHSVRLPLSNGGWKNCYCSFKCMERYITDIITATLVGRMKQQLDDIGIRNR